MSTWRVTARRFAEADPTLRCLLRIEDCICRVIKSLLNCIYRTLVLAFKFIHKILEKFGSTFLKYLRAVPGLKQYVPGPVEYKRLDVNNNKKRKVKPPEPLPYGNNSYKRSLTYYGGLILGAMLYLFVYWVLIKSHSFVSITVAFLLLMAYLVILENSHNLRSIMMLCLPIMVTNRGRALVFCYMISITWTGPLKNLQYNLSQLMKSIHCCKQYLIIKTDEIAEENVVQNIVQAEKIILKLVSEVKQFAEQVRERVDVVIKLAITIEDYLVRAINKLVDIVNVCNVHTKEVFSNCEKTFEFAYQDCKDKLGSGIDILCEIVEPLKTLCQAVHIPNFLCSIPMELIQFVDRTVGERLRYYIQVIENEFYVEVDIQHKYLYNGTRSKPYSLVIKEVESDLERKFWYIRIVARMFNLVSLVLVIWILITATKYHLHYLEDVKYDNIYLDDYIKEIDDRRKKKKKHRKDKEDSKIKVPSSDWALNDVDDETLLIQDNPSPEEDEDDLKFNEDSYLFPMTAAHKRKYYESCSFLLNDTEKDKLILTTLIWWAICGFLTLFAVGDFSLYKLIELVETILNNVLFKEDLPLVAITSAAGDQMIRLNRTYLSQTRAKALDEYHLRKNSTNYREGSLGAMYRRLMNSLEEKIPDDVAILDSLQQCLPVASQPKYDTYKCLLYLAGVTLIFVLLETYALRTRHCVANLYYPRRARKRAAWLYQKLVSEKPKFASPEPMVENQEGKLTQLITKGLIGGRTMQIAKS